MWIVCQAFSFHPLFGQIILDVLFRLTYLDSLPGINDDIKDNSSQLEDNTYKLCSVKYPLFSVAWS